MNVWMVYQDAITPDFPGGTRHYDFAMELANKGNCVKIFAANVNLSLRKQVKDVGHTLFSEERIGLVAFEWVSTCSYQRNNWRRAFNMIIFGLNAYRTGTLQDDDPDIIIGSSPNLFAAFAACLLAKQKRTRFILEIRDIWPQVLIDMGISKYHPLVIVFRFIEKYLYDNADGFVVLAKGTIKYLTDYGIERGMISYIPNGVHLEHFKTQVSRDEARKKFGFDTFTIVYSGVHGPSHSLQTLLESANELRNEPIKFVLIGDGSKKNELIDKAQELGLDNVRFLSPLPKKEISSLLSAADVGVVMLKNVPVFRYGISPNKLFDYMAAGLPVIASVQGEVEGFIRRVGCGLSVVPENSQELSKAIMELYSKSESELREMGRYGRAEIEKNFSRVKLVSKLETSIKNACAINV